MKGQVFDFGKTGSNHYLNPFTSFLVVRVERPVSPGQRTSLLLTSPLQMLIKPLYRLEERLFL
jgi:hypothetical protein